MAMQLVTNNLQLATSKVRTALDHYGKAVSGVSTDTDKTQITVNLSNCPKEFLQCLLMTDLTDGQRKAVAALVGDRREILEQVVSNHRDLFKLLKALDIPGQPTVEVKVGTRWYPVPVNSLTMAEATSYAPGHCCLTANYQICDHQGQVSGTWGSWSFKDSSDKQVSKTVKELLEEEGIRVSTPEAVDRIREKMDKADRARKQVGKVLSTMGSVLKTNQWLWRSSL